MTTGTLPHRVRDGIAYWSQWLLLNLFGPAQQDAETDPLEQLKRRYGHATRT